MVRAPSAPRAGRWSPLAVLPALAAALVAVSLVLPRVPWWPALRDPALPWVVLLDVRDEGSVHTWFNVVLLGVGALVATACGLARRSAGEVAWPWLVVGAVLGALSIDDSLALHERLEPLGEEMGGGSGALHFAWVLPGALLGAGLLGAVALAVRRLPRRSRVPVVVGLVLLLVAALGLEVVGAAVLDGAGDGPAYILVSHLEELLESLAACLLLAGVVRGVRWHPYGTSGAPDRVRSVT